MKNIYRKALVEEIKIMKAICVELRKEAKSAAGVKSYEEALLKANLKDAYEHVVENLEVALYQADDSFKNGGRRAAVKKTK